MEAEERCVQYTHIGRRVGASAERATTFEAIQDPGDLVDEVSLSIVVVLFLLVSSFPVTCNIQLLYKLIARARECTHRLIEVKSPRLLVHQKPYTGSLEVDDELVAAGHTTLRLG